MANNTLHVEPHHERLDADAVCERCGTVNPEDTLLCKTCGNNLRDQRRRRVAAGVDAEIAGPRNLRWSWLASALAVLGLLLVVWLGLNADNIAESVFAVDTTTDMAGQLWTGPAQGIYDELKQELLANPVSTAEAQAARANPLIISDFSGRYLIMSDPTRGIERQLGTGIVRQDGESLHFVAVLDRYDAEVRGQAVFVGEATPAARDSAGIRIGNDYVLGSGVALRRGEDEGGYVCHVQPLQGAPMTVLLYKIR